MHLGKFPLVAATIALLTLGVGANAQLTISYADAGAGPFQLQGETASILAGTGNAILTNGVAQMLDIDTLFTSNLGSPGEPSQAFDASRIFTINGVSGTLIQSLNINITFTVDTISVDGDNTTTYNLGGGSFVDVTTVVSSIQASSVGTTSGPIEATFLYHTAAVPEPGSVALLIGMGFSGAGFLARRRKNAHKAA
jgi:hypothetical protein